MLKNELFKARKINNELVKLKNGNYFNKEQENDTNIMERLNPYELFDPYLISEDYDNYETFYPYYEYLKPEHRGLRIGYEYFNYISSDYDNDDID